MVLHLTCVLPNAWRGCGQYYQKEDQESDLLLLRGIQTGQREAKTGKSEVPWNS